MYESLKNSTLSEQQKTIIKKKHFHVEIVLKYNKEASLYEDIFNNIRAIKGVTIIQIIEPAEDVSPTQKAVLIKIKFMPYGMPVLQYEAGLRSEILKIKSVRSLRYTTSAKLTKKK